MLSARGDVNEIEGYFCIIGFKGKANTPVPKSTQVHVTVFSPNPRSPSDVKSAIYAEKLLTFDVTFLQSIKVESQFTKGIQLYGNHRQERVRILSNTHFSVQVQNANPEDADYELIKYRVDRSGPEEKQEYSLSITVPQEISHDF